MDKATYRRLYKEKRIAMTSEKLLLLDNMLLKHLKDLDFSNIHYLHIYLSISKFNEPDTFGFIDYIRTSFPKIQLVVSRTDFQTNTMVNYLWNDDLILEESKWGILEPKEGVICEDSSIDMVIIPLLIADKMGNRVGYGKGFYDKFLANCRSDTRKIGISYFEPVASIKDVADWDVALDVLVTPQNIYYF